MQKVTDSQKDKNKYHVLTYIYGISKNGTVDYICRIGMGTQTGNNRLVDIWGKERVGQMERVALGHIHYNV